MSRNIATIPPERGVCQICEGKPEIINFKGSVEAALSAPEKPTTLRFIDLATKQKFGPCCVEAMKFTDHMLTIHGRRAGIVHPGDPTPNTY